MQKFRFIIAGFIFVVIIILCNVFPSLLHQLDAPDEFLIFMNKGNRQGHLYDAVEAYKAEKTDLIRYVDFVDQDQSVKKAIFPMETAGDDLGIYYFIPKISVWFNLTSIEAYNVFCYIALFGSYFIAILGFHLLFKKKTPFILASVLYGILTFFCFYVQDVYIFSFVACSFIPMIIWAAKHKMYAVQITAILVVCFIAGWLNIMRNHAGTGIIIFLLTGIIFALHKLTTPKKLILIALLASFFIPKWMFHRIIENRNEQLIQKGFDERMFQGFMFSHIVWHSLYLGLGYEKDNKYGIVWADDYGYQTARQYAKENPQENIPKFNPLSMPKEYEGILKKKYTDIVMHDFSFAFKTYWAKFLSCLKKFLLFFNVGIVLLFFKKRSIKILLPFLFAILFYLLPGVLVWPHYLYIVGALSMGMVCSILLINDQIEAVKV